MSLRAVQGYPPKMTAALPVNRTAQAAGLMLTYAVIVACADKFVGIIAAEASVWQFHFTRTLMGLALLAVAAPFMGLKLRPNRPGAVVARSLVHGTALLVYFASLGFLSVAQAGAGLFSAPIFVLLISRLVYGQRIGPVRILAVILGSVGVLLVLGPAATSELGLASLLPIAAGFFYAVANIATRQWCAGESAMTLTTAYFVTMGVFGALGMAVLTLFPVHPVPEGSDGFLLRGPVSGSGAFYLWSFVQAVASVVGVALAVRAYQLTEASRASIFEYVFLPMSAMWAWLLWGQPLGWTAAGGIVLIFVAGIMIVARGR